MASRHLSIPPPFRAGIGLLATLSKQQVESLMVILREGPESRTTSAMKRAAGNLRGMSPSELEAALSSLKALYKVRANSRLSREDFASELIRALIRVKPLAIKASQTLRAVSNIETLLSVDSLELSQKRSALMHDSEKRFCNLRVLVDLQPIFTGEDEQLLREIVVSFNLKLGYHVEGEQHRDIYLKIDRDDIMSIRSALDKAEEQARLLEGQLKGLMAGV